MKNENVYVGHSKNLDCRGMFASRDFKKGETIEVCPLVLVRYKSEKRRIGGKPTESVMDNYYFEWSKRYFVIPGGYGMFYNHSYTPNAYYARDYKNKTLKFIALKKILKGEEVMVNYNGEPYSKRPITEWFFEHFGKEIK